MKFIKQYPYISSLLIFSVAMFFIGIYAAFIMSIAGSGRNQRYKTDESYPKVIYSHDNPPVAAVPASEPKETDKPDSTVIKKVGTAKATFYNKYNDHTLTQTDYLPFRKVGSTEFTMIAYFEKPGFTLEVPDNISLRLVLLAKDESYATDRTFKIFLDRELLFNSESSLEESKMDKATFTTSLIQEIPYHLFSRVAKAKKVRLQIGTTLIDLKEREIQSFRDLVELVESTEITPEGKVPQLHQ